MRATPVATWEIKAARLLVRLLEDRNAPVNTHLRRLASRRLPQEKVDRRPQPACGDPAMARRMAETNLAGYRSILRNHADLSNEERQVIEDSIRQTEDLLGVLRQDEQGT